MRVWRQSISSRKRSSTGNASLARFLVCAFALAAPLLVHAAAAGAVHANARDKSRGYLGIEFHDPTDEEISALHLIGPHGAEIMMVDHDGPAGKSGLQPHDIVLQMDGQNIESADDIRRRIRESTPGRTIKLSILRLGRTLTMTAKLADQKELESNPWMQHLIPPPPPPIDDGVGNVLVQRYSVETVTGPRSQSRTQSFIGTVLRSGPYTGATLDAMEPQLADFFGVPPKTGLLVHAVETNSPAATAGLRAGDIVLRVDTRPVATTSDWTKRLRASGGKPVTLSILREKHEETLTMQTAKAHSLLEWPRFF